MKVNIDNDTALEMLLKRLKNWTSDETTIRLFETMYEHQIDGGVFEDGDFDIVQIVDNDYVNWCSVISHGDSGFSELLGLYRANGLGDVSCEDTGDTGAGFIEAVDNEAEPTAFLIRQ